MEKEIEINFPGFYKDLKDKHENSKEEFNKSIEDNFIELNSINSLLTTCIKRLREGNDLLVEKSIHKDVEHVRETYKKKMDELKDDIKDTRNEVTISQLENRVTKLLMILKHGI